jgi:adenine-specific DNA-methyltransferase
VSKKPNGKRVPVSSLKHKDKRTNIPTRELQNFVKDEEKSPKTVSYPGLLYARDPSLDPQLVWKGKDERTRSRSKCRPCRSTSRRRSTLRPSSSR